MIGFLIIFKAAADWIFFMRDIINEAVKDAMRSKEKFPHIPVKLSFETPNYKVQAGRFKEKLNGLKTLDTLKSFFPSAFLITRKD